MKDKKYATVRAMIDLDQANSEDIFQLLDCIQEETDEIMKDHKREVLDLISKKNPTTIKTLGKRNTEMSDVLLEILEPKLAERDAKRDAERDAKRDAERDAKRDAERDAKRDAERDAKRDAERDAKRDAERDAVHDAELKNNILFSIVQEGKMSLESAAAWLHLSIEEFVNQMNHNGFTIPSNGSVHQ